MTITYIVTHIHLEKTLEPVTMPSKGAVLESRDFFIWVGFVASVSEDLFEACSPPRWTIHPTFVMLKNQDVAKNFETVRRNE